MDKTQAWDAVLVRLSEKISRMEFHTWFKKVRIAEISGGAVLVSCPTEMNKNWLESKYHGVILSNLRGVLPEIEKLYFNVDLTLADGPPSNPSVFEDRKAPRKLPNRPDVKIAEGLESRIVHAKFTLRNFVVGDENRLAHSACAAVAEGKKGEPKKYNPLFIYGGVGLGKTHLLQGTANEIMRRNADATVVYTTAERLTNEIVKAIRERQMEGLRKKYRRVDALIIDDVQFFEGKEKTQEELFNTFNDLFEFHKQIIFSADRPPVELEGISDRLQSRMGWGLTVDVQMPGYETRLAIIQEKSKDIGLMLGSDVQEFVAANVRRSLREMENLLNQIQAEVELRQLSPTVQSVSKIFRKLNPSDNLETADGARKGYAKSPDDIITAVSEYFQVPATELLGESRKQGIVFPRQIAWTLCRDVLRMSHESIGRDFGGKNHTTIMHGIRKISDLKRKDSATARHIHALRKDLGVK
ncbi:chromosomal replication initiator protein DnaA [Candidatus Gracilibacteria bacterium]|nr:chromosomal replication initiator protein DnaA [Candidatus Gracilibacteria bacterium]